MNETNESIDRLVRKLGLDQEQQAGPEQKNTTPWTPDITRISKNLEDILQVRIGWACKLEYATAFCIYSHSGLAGDANQARPGREGAGPGKSRAHQGAASPDSVDGLP